MFGRSLLLGGRGLVTRQAVRSFAKAAKGGSAKAAEKGINIFKDRDEPELLADDQYPEWLFGLLEPQATYEELKDKQAEGTELTDGELKRLKAMESRKLIKSQNATR